MEEPQAVDTQTQRNVRHDEAETRESSVAAAEILNVVESARGKKRWQIPDEIWNSHKGVIYDLYITKNLTLSATMEIMTERHGFSASYVHTNRNLFIHILTWIGQSSIKTG